MLAPAAVTNGKIATDAVGANEIAAGGVGVSELAANAVTSPAIAANAVTTAKILDGAVTMAKISAPIGNAVINPIPASSTGSQTIFPTATVTTDSAGSCFVNAWAMTDSASNASFYLEPAVLNTATGASTFPNPSALVPTVFPSGAGGGYMASSSAVLPVAANTTYRFGCHFGTVGVTIAAPYCRVSWICN
jgi:hypothetical protein